MKSLRKTIVTRRFASFALALVLSFGLVSVYTTPVMATETSVTYTESTAIISPRTTVYYPTSGRDNRYIPTNALASEVCTYTNLPNNATIHISCSYSAQYSGARMVVRQNGSVVGEFGLNDISGNPMRFSFRHTSGTVTVQIITTSVGFEKYYGFNLYTN